VALWRLGALATGFTWHDAEPGSPEAGDGPVVDVDVELTAAAE
jgi:hypothetical protein